MKTKLYLLTLLLLAASVMHAQNIVLEFNANHTCAQVNLDSIWIENLTQGGKMVLYYPDNVAVFIITGIGEFNLQHNHLFVSQNYPNPFSAKTYIDVYLQTPDVISLNVYDLTGLNVAGYEDKLEEGMHRFSFSAGMEKTYILTVTSGKHVEKRIMLQMGLAGSAVSEISYLGVSSEEEPKTAPKSSEFNFNPGDDLRFTGFVTDGAGNMDYSVINDAPEASTDYLFDIANTPPEQPSAISGEDYVPENTTGLVYEVEEHEGLTYLWSVPDGWEITHGQGSHAITVNAGGEGGEISVKAENNCGLSEASVLLVEVYVPMFELILDSDPPNGGEVIGGGSYQSGEEVDITAIASQDWEFVEWSGDIDYIGDTSSAITIVTMPGYDISLTANFSQFSCGDDITFTYRGEEVTYGTIERGGLCWLDRNLGADPMPFVPADDATGNTDTRLYGDLFQWGRLDDGHQDRTSSTTPGPVNQDVPGHGNFITSTGSPHDWRSPQNNNLWQGEDGINNPCPPGWRVSTEAELNAERQSWISNDQQGAYASTLKWPVGGYRQGLAGTLYNVDIRGYVWSSSVSGTWARILSFSSDNANMLSYGRVLGLSVRCVRNILVYNLNLEVNPENAGIVNGEGMYPDGLLISVTANANEGWEFVNWTGDTEYLDDVNSAEAIVTMPAYDINLIANFNEETDYPVYGDGVTDIDGNEYVTVIIGNQEWMAENLRVTRYNNEDDIPTGLSDTEWESTTSGAYAIYNNDEDMLEAYGKLYNWYAVDDERGLCPEGWSVPSDADWTALVNYVVSQGFPNSNVVNGAGNALKSCRQVGSPLEGCNTSEHPRWNSHSTHYGFDEFGFSALPGGYRGANGVCSSMGLFGYWWSSSEYSSTSAWGRGMYSFYGSVDRGDVSKSYGFSVRCVRDIDN